MWFGASGSGSGSGLEPLVPVLVLVWSWCNVCVSGVVTDPYPKDRLSGFAMATKTCRAAKLYQRPLNSMRSLAVLK